MAARKQQSSPSLAADAKDEQRTAASPIWLAALSRYYAELSKGGMKHSVIDKELWNIESPDDLLAQIQTLVPVETSTKVGICVLTKLEAILVGLNDFAAIVAWSLGMNGKVAAVIWGSIRLIVKFAQPVLPDLVDMLQELQRTLPRVQKYEQELPITHHLERALLDMYSEIIVFCAYAKTFFRNNPNIGRSRSAWSQFSRDFASVILNLRAYSRRVDEAADMVRLSREAHTAETVAALQGKPGAQTCGVELPCHAIPYGLNLRFFGRSKAIETLSIVLEPKREKSAMQAVAIHGLGGVGKSQLALHYANTSLQMYDVIIWIPAESQIKLVQALSIFISKLGLSNDKKDDNQSIQKARDWLNSCGRPFLLIFDNVEDADILEQIWPATTNASVIITTRSPSVASRRTANVLSLECFDTEEGSEVLLALTGKQPSGEADLAAIPEICRLLGGLPLAMDQISNFMTDRGCLYEEFLEIYKKSAEKVLVKSKAPVEYNYTSATTWDLSIARLSADAKTLLNILAFLDPDLILERLITDTKATSTDPRLGFFFDDFDFGDAVMELSQTSLIRRLANSRAISIHRLVQFVVFTRIPTADKIFYFDTAVQILYYDFPNTWKGTGSFQGHGFGSWKTCSAVLPHVSWLMATSQKYGLAPSRSDLWTELVFRAGTYLWEREQPSLARAFFQFGLSVELAPTLSTPSRAQAYRLLGHIYLDLAQPRAALQAYTQSLALRLQIDGPDTPPVADVYDSIACSYTEIGDMSQADDNLARAIAIHNAHNPDNMARTEAIRAMASLRAGKPADALDAIRHCWQLQGLTQEQVANSRYPKHSGDIALLARIYWAQGDEAEAQRLAARTVEIRRGLFGRDGGPRVADSLFLLARMLQHQEEHVLAAKLLREVVDMSRGMVEMRGHLARALWFLAEVEEAIQGEENTWTELRQNAKDERDKITAREGGRGRCRRRRVHEAGELDAVVK